MDAVDRIPFKDYPYDLVHQVCCENVIGYVPVPLGIAGPLRLDDRPPLWIPLGTTEGALIASISRGCKAAGRIRTVLLQDAMTRGPVVGFPGIVEAAAFKAWIEDPATFSTHLAPPFQATSQHLQLLSVKARLAGRLVFLRYAARTGEAMGMNMISKATEASLLDLKANHFAQMEIISLSGNYCSDKKGGSSVNWIEGRGKSVVAEAWIPSDTVRQVLKVDDLEGMVRMAQTKNLVGSAMAGNAGSGGCNSHAANIVAGIFIACGQDVAQVVDSSACMTLLEIRRHQSSKEPFLYITVTMPCLEVGTVGGGTRLPAQSQCIEMLAPGDAAGDRACLLARAICAAVLAGELSLLASLAAGTLVKSHLNLNRAK